MSAIITQPTVRVVAATQFFGNPDQPIPADGTDAERLGAYAGKGCYGFQGGANGRPNIENQRQVIENAHGSVLEHSTASLFIKGITRALTLELNRHLPLSISQASTRYIDGKDANIVLEPYMAALWERYYPSLGFYSDVQRYFVGDRQFRTEEDRRRADMVVDHVNAQLDALAGYSRRVEQLLDVNPYGLAGTELRKWARGKARNETPHGMETYGTWTGNHRAWRFFIELRSEQHAEDEVRRLAGCIYDAVQPLAPTYYQGVTITEVRGLREFVFDQKKV